MSQAQVLCTPNIAQWLQCVQLQSSLLHQIFPVTISRGEGEDEKVVYVYARYITCLEKQKQSNSVIPVVGPVQPIQLAGI